ncbi:Outer membrane protein (porin) [Noviherbaspirillum humi]|uniref:Outer membrane protein (Porin) n=1 Tax=Noviherbaspirillum humi TaxID=1688639 RepID=A0A239LA82_9BURK|nr:porin [Noviherbaspirillum humi]SNT26763.1 Outer membrane protein (porin) [Noviherbaspirillum humi]
MKKSLLALAVLGAFAGAANAQTSVSIYGIADVGVKFDNGGSTAGRQWSLASGQQSGSRIGFRGTEDLGGGLSAVFTLENGFNIDDGTLGNGGRLFGRQAWVGLDSKALGSIKFGRQYSSVYNALLAIDPFGINMSGDAQAAYGYGIGKLDPIARSDNTITYATPNFGGFTALLGYKLGEQAGAFNAGSSKFVGLGYAAGPLNVQLAYQDTNALGLAVTGGLATVTNAIGLSAAGTGAVGAKVKNTFAGATYDFGVAKAHLAFGDTKLQGTADSTIRNYMLGVSAPIGADSVFASWNRVDLRDVANGKANQYAVGYSHPLSKRTNLYASVGYTRNDSGVRLNAATNGTSDRTALVGVRHAF